MLGNHKGKSLLKLVFLFACFLGTSRCGLDTGSGGGSIFLNDPVPAGVRGFPNQLIGQNGQHVTGVAVLYRSGASYVLRLEGITVPAEPALQVRVLGSVVPTQSFQLRASTGNQNYPLSTGQGVTSVNIHSSQKNIEYA